jgi:predicted dehydrogenase
VVTDLDNALSHHPQAVIVANPTALHLEVAIPAAMAGCHLLLEKPISHSMEGISELTRAVEHGGGQVLVGFQYRYHPCLIQALHFLEEGVIGRPLSTRAVYGEYLPNMHPWEDYHQSYSSRKDLGGGVILTLCHPLDTLRWMLGCSRFSHLLAG